MSASGGCTTAASIVARIDDLKGGGTRSRCSAVWTTMGVINIILQPKSSADDLIDY